MLVVSLGRAFPRMIGHYTASFSPDLPAEAGIPRWQGLSLANRADHRAGYHAFLAAGLLAFVLVGDFRSGEREPEDPQELAALSLALLCARRVALDPEVS